MTINNNDLAGCIINLFWTTVMLIALGVVVATVPECHETLQPGGAP